MLPNITEWNGLVFMLNGLAKFGRKGGAKMNARWSAKNANSMSSAQESML